MIKQLITVTVLTLSLLTGCTALAPTDTSVIEEYSDYKNGIVAFGMMQGVWSRVFTAFAEHPDWQRGRNDAHAKCIELGFKHIALEENEVLSIALHTIPRVYVQIATARCYD